MLPQPPQSPSNKKTQDGSVKPKLPKPKIDLRALFDYFSRKRHLKKNRWRPSDRDKAAKKKTAKCKEQGTRERRRQPRVAGKKPRKKKKLTERVVKFPFVERLYRTKRIPFRMVYLYEQAALNGYLRYIETLKIEKLLKKTLTQLNAGDDLENESLESRKHKYLDEDGPLSPIEETNEDDPTESSADNEEIGAKIVEKSCFILSSEIPEKKKRKRMSNVLDSDCWGRSWLAEECMEKHRKLFRFLNHYEIFLLRCYAHPPKQQLHVKGIQIMNSNRLNWHGLG